MENSSSSKKVPLPKNYLAWHVERKATKSQQTTPIVPQIKWRCPAKVALKDCWCVASGKESHETETQRNRELIVAEELYGHPSSIPPNSPSDLLDKGGLQNDDSQTPVISLTPCEDKAPCMEAKRGESKATTSSNTCLGNIDRQSLVGLIRNPALTISLALLNILASNPDLRPAMLNSITDACASLPTNLENLSVWGSVSKQKAMEPISPCCCEKSTRAKKDVAIQTENAEDQEVVDESNSSQTPQENVRSLVRPQFDEAPHVNNLTIRLMSNKGLSIPQITSTDQGPEHEAHDLLRSTTVAANDSVVLNGNAEEPEHEAEDLLRFATVANDSVVLSGNAEGQPEQVLPNSTTLTPPVGNSGSLVTTIRCGMNPENDLSSGLSIPHQISTDEVRPKQETWDFQRSAAVTNDVVILNENAESTPEALRTFTTLPPLVNSGSLECGVNPENNSTMSIRPEQESIDDLIEKYSGPNAVELKDLIGHHGMVEQVRPIPTPPRLDHANLKSLAEQYGASSYAMGASSVTPPPPPPINNYAAVMMNRAIPQPTTALFRPHNHPSFGPPGPGMGYPPLVPIPNSSQVGIRMAAYPMINRPPFAAQVPRPSIIRPNLLVQHLAAGKIHVTGRSNNVQQPNKKKQKPCKYFSSSTGCRNGDNCSFQHIVVVPEQSTAGGNVDVQGGGKRMRLG